MTPIILNDQEKAVVIAALVEYQFVLKSPMVESAPQINGALHLPPHQQAQALITATCSQVQMRLQNAKSHDLTDNSTEQ